MDRRRLMYAPDDRLEVVDVERPRIEVAIPSDDVEWMMIEDQLIDSVLLLDQERAVAHLVVRVELERAADVALRIRGAFFQLPELVAIAFRPAHVPAAFHDEQLRLRGLFCRPIELVAMQDAAVDD